MKPLREYLKHLSLYHRFMLVSFAILVLGMLGIGRWVGDRISDGVVHESALNAALYVESFVAPQLQELAQRDGLSEISVGKLSALLQGTALGKRIVAFKVWNLDGRVLYSSNDSASIGQTFPIEDSLASAMRGQVMGEISTLTAAENVAERRLASQLLEVYSPVRLHGSNRIIAIAEFYEGVDSLAGQIASSQRQSWLVVGLTALTMYLLLLFFVQRATRLIDSQQDKLADQVQRLADLVKQNTALYGRVQAAAASIATHNERLLRRISAELHDGPVQDLGFVLLRLDHAIFATETTSLDNPVAKESALQKQWGEELITVQESLRHALQEMRAIAAGLGLPQLHELTVPKSLFHVIRAHSRRTGTKVAWHFDALPEQAPLPTKITMYRVVQEALTNAYRHANGKGQAVEVAFTSGQLEVAISDQGQGFDTEKQSDWENHLGLVGMRERVESIGGQFCISSRAGHGTKITARLPA